MTFSHEAASSTEQFEGLFSGVKGLFKAKFGDLVSDVKALFKGKFGKNACEDFDDVSIKCDPELLKNRFPDVKALLVAKFGSEYSWLPPPLPPPPAVVGEGAVRARGVARTSRPPPLTQGTGRGEEACEGPLQGQV